MEFDGKTPEEAVKFILHDRPNSMNASGGLIAIDNDGDILPDF